MNRRRFFQTLFATFAAWKWTMAEVPEAYSLEEYETDFYSRLSKVPFPYHTPFQDFLKKIEGEPIDHWYVRDIP